MAKTKIKTRRIDNIPTRLVLDGPGNHLAGFCDALADLLEAKGITVDRDELKSDAAGICTPDGHLDLDKIAR